MKTSGREVVELAKIARAAPPGKRRRLIADFLRLKRAPSSPSLSGDAPSVRLGGLNLRYLSRDALLFMFKEVMVDESYSFESHAESPFIVDAGANIGLATLFLKQRFPHARVLAIEPEPTTFGVLTANVSANGLTDVELQNVALTARHGAVEFHHRPGSLRSSILPQRGPKDATSMVRGVPLSSLFDERIDFLKLDVEGSENAVVEDLAESGKLLLVDQMACEYHHNITPDRQSLARLLALLEEHEFGYQVRARLPRAFAHDSVQDVMIYAYRRP